MCRSSRYKDHEFMFLQIAVELVICHLSICTPNFLWWKIIYYSNIVWWAISALLTFAKTGIDKFLILANLSRKKRDMHTSWNTVSCCFMYHFKKRNNSLLIFNTKIYFKNQNLSKHTLISKTYGIIFFSIFWINSDRNSKIFCLHVWNC